MPRAALFLMIALMGMTFQIAVIRPTHARPNVGVKGRLLGKVVLATTTVTAEDQVFKVIKIDLDGDGLDETIRLNAYDLAKWKHLGQLEVLDAAGKVIFAGPRESAQSGPEQNKRSLCFGYFPVSHMDLDLVGDLFGDGNVELLSRDSYASDVREYPFRIFRWDRARRVFTLLHYGYLKEESDQADRLRWKTPQEHDQASRGSWVSNISGLGLDGTVSLTLVDRARATYDTIRARFDSSGCVGIDTYAGRFAGPWARNMVGSGAGRYRFITIQRHVLSIGVGVTVDIDNDRMEGPGALEGALVRVKCSRENHGLTARHISFLHSAPSMARPVIRIAPAKVPPPLWSQISACGTLLDDRFSVGTDVRHWSLQQGWRLEDNALRVRPPYKGTSASLSRTVPAGVLIECVFWFEHSDRRQSLSLQCGSDNRICLDIQATGTITLSYHSPSTEVVLGRAKHPPFPANRKLRAYLALNRSWCAGGVEDVHHPMKRLELAGPCTLDSGAFWLHAFLARAAFERIRIQSINSFAIGKAGSGNSRTAAVRRSGGVFTPGEPFETFFRRFVAAYMRSDRAALRLMISPSGVTRASKMLKVQASRRVETDIDRALTAKDATLRILRSGYIRTGNKYSCPSVAYAKKYEHGDGVYHGDVVIFQLVGGRWQCTWIDYED